MSTSSLANALIIVLCISAVIYLGQSAILSINPEQTGFLDKSDNLLYNYGNESGVNNFNASSEIPDSADTVSADSDGNIFTDAYKTITSWVAETTGANYVIGILKAPYNILAGMGLPSGVVWVLGSLWYGVIIFLIISWLRGI